MYLKFVVYVICLIFIENCSTIKDIEYEQVISDRYLYSINRNQSNYWNILPDIRSSWQVCSLPQYHHQSNEGVWLFIQREKQENLYQMSFFSIFKNGTLTILSNIEIENNQTYFVTSHDEITKEKYTGALITLNKIQLILCNQLNATNCSIIRTISFSSVFITNTKKINTGFFISDLQSLYIGTDSGLHRLNLNTYEIIYNLNQINQSVSSISLSSKYQTIFIGTEAKLWMEKYSNETSEWRFEHVNGLIDAPITSLVYDHSQDQLWIGQNTGITLLSPKILLTGRLVWYFTRLSGYKSNPGSYNSHLPLSNITTLMMSYANPFDNKIWLGSIYGLVRYHFNTTESNTWRVFNSARYMPMYSSIVNISSIGIVNRMKNCSDNLGSSVVAITSNGLSVLRFEMWSLEKKAEYFQTYLDQSNRHIRYDYVSDCAMTRQGDPNSCVKGANDNDGLWTSMYLSSQIFRYVITNDSHVQQTAWKHFQALYFLSKITGISGYPARSIARKDEFPPTDGWFPSPVNASLQYRGDTSSDEIVGHEFIYPLVYDYLCQNSDQCSQASEVLLNITNHILTHDWYLIGENHTHTTWGIWNPKEINNDPYYQETRGLNSLQILAFLFQAYSFTSDDRYLDGIDELIQLYQYDINLINQKMIAVCDIDFSDDELEYLSYFTIIYAFHRIKTSKIQNERVNKLIQHFQEYIFIGIELSHKYKQMDKSPFYNWIYCYVLNQLNSTMSNCDALIYDGLWYLQRFPLELVNWEQYNTIRLDLELNQLASCLSDELYSRKILPPDERNIHKWNGSPFSLNQGDASYEEDPSIFLISYWGMRFFRFIEN